MIAYKVVREKDGRLYSCTARGKARLEYVPGSTVNAPEGTALFVFRDVLSAKEFALGLWANSGHRYEVWSCSGEKSSRSLERVAHGYASFNQMLKVWNGYVPKKRHYRAPYGTVFMKRLRLDRKLMRFSEYYD